MGHPLGRVRFRAGSWPTARRWRAWRPAPASSRRVPCRARRGSRRGPRRDQRERGAYFVGPRRASCGASSRSPRRRASAPSSATAGRGGPRYSTDTEVWYRARTRVRCLPK